MGIRTALKKHIGYSEHNKTCINCAYVAETSGGNFKCTQWDNVTELCVMPEGSCNHWDIVSSCGDEPDKD